MKGANKQKQVEQSQLLPLTVTIRVSTGHCALSIITAWSIMLAATTCHLPAV